MGTKTDKGHFVHIPANVYRGKYYDYGTIPFFVSCNDATTKEEACQWVMKNREEVIFRIEKMRVRVGDRMVLAVRRPAKNNVFFRDGNYRVDREVLTRIV